VKAESYRHIMSLSLAMTKCRLTHYGLLLPVCVTDRRNCDHVTQPGVLPCCLPYRVVLMLRGL